MGYPAPVFGTGRDERERDLGLRPYSPANP
jgi:hypothetical protein